MAASDLERPPIHASPAHESHGPGATDSTGGPEEHLETLTVSSDWNSDRAPHENADLFGPPRLPSPSVTYTSNEAASPHEASDGEYSDGASAEKPLPTLSRKAIAQRLARIARLLATTPDDHLRVDNLALVEQVNSLEIILMGIQDQDSSLQNHGPQPHPTPRLDTGMGDRSHHDLHVARQAVVAAKSETVAASATQLSADLVTLLDNLRARHEESTHVHNVLVSRLERAAQRILFLQRHVQSLETRLGEHDHEFTNLRVLVKALEVQVPEHPDAELRRCLGKVKQELRTIRQRRNTLSEVRSLMFQEEQDGRKHEEINEDDT